MSDIGLSPAQGRTLEVLVSLVGMTGVRKAPPQGDSIVLDLLPASHVIGGAPFAVRIPPDGTIWPITDQEAGITRRPHMSDLPSS